MVGTALKKYAERAGLTCDGGYVYGKVRHRHIALVDGTGVKMLQIYLCPPGCAAGDVRMLQARRILESCDAREYRLIRQNAVNVGDGRAVVVFQDGPGAMNRIERYISEVMPRLDDVRFDGDACACCGEPLGEAAGYALLDDYILPLHPECIPEIAARQSSLEGGGEGSLIRGALGALLGSLMGAALWAALYLAGFVAGIAGLFVGLFSNGFYGLLGGRNGKARAVIVAAALVLGVLAGQLGGMTAMYGRSFSESDAAGMTRKQYVLTRFEQTLIADQETALRRFCERTGTDAEAQEEYIRRNWNPEYSANRSEELCELGVNLGMGLTFGGLGILGLFFRKNRETRRRSIRRLK